MKRRRLFGGILATVGYLLSPLSWWNDVFVNFPLAYAGAWVVSFFERKAFGTAFVAFYWVTNILGFFLMHKGICQMVKENCTDKEYFAHGFWKDLLIALLYTGVILILLKFKVLQPPQDYFQR